MADRTRARTAEFVAAAAGFPPTGVCLWQDAAASLGWSSLDRAPPSKGPRDTNTHAVQDDHWASNDEHVSEVGRGRDDGRDHNGTHYGMPEVPHQHTSGE